MVVLELLTYHKVELAATCLAVAIGFVETVSPVDTQQTNHWQVDTQTCTERHSAADLP